MAFDVLFVPPQAEGHAAEALIADLRLDVLLDAMADGDEPMAQACRRVLLTPLTDVRAIAARRAVRGDIEACPKLFETLYAAARDGLSGAARYAEYQKPRYDRIIPNQKKLLTEVEIAKLYLKAMRRMQAAVAQENATFRSRAVQALAQEITARFSPAATQRMERRIRMLDSLKLTDDLTLHASIGGGLKPKDVVLGSLGGGEGGKRRRQEAGIVIPLSSVGLIRNAEDVVQSAVYPLLRTVADGNKGLRQYFETLVFQLGFYLGCVRLRKRLLTARVPLCEPQLDDGCGGVQSEALRSASLALQQGKAPTGNTVSFAGKRRIVITGVNQGGKTTFLRSLGQAQLMAQCGLFVAAESYRCPLYRSIFTHFPSGEDTARGLGLLDVELRKLRLIVDALWPHSLLLLNETFQTTMPLDAKYLAENTVGALADIGVTVVFVTHLYAYAAAAYAEGRSDTLFLRAERGGGAQSTYALIEGEPYSTAAADDLYREVLGG